MNTFEAFPVNAFFMRYFFELSYNGKDYHGWQRQPTSISVQEVIEEKLFLIHSEKEYPIVGCGRTDTGVHASFYVFHVDLPVIDDVDQFRFKLNRMLPDSIAIHAIREVDDEKHARFDATERTYRYYIHHQKDPFLADISWYLPQQLDFAAMNEAATILIGKQDFTSLSKLHTDAKTNICDVRQAEWIQIDDFRTYFEITADRFLRNMVRATVGTLVDVGTGKLQPEDVRSILEAKDRSEASVSVPAHGLFLYNVSY